MITFQHAKSCKILMEPCKSRQSHVARTWHVKPEVFSEHVS